MKKTKKVTSVMLMLAMAAGLGTGAAAEGLSLIHI